MKPVRYVNQRGRAVATSILPARRLVLVLAVLAVPSVVASPPVWELTMGPSTVRIAGSVHYLRESDYPLPAVLRRIYGEADTLVVEYDTHGQETPVDPMVLARRVPRAGRLDTPGPLRRFLSTSEFTALRRLARERGYDVNRLDDMKPWFAGMYVLDRELEAAGFRSDLGLDSQLLERAYEDNKPVISLESASDQRRLFRGVPLADQVDFLAEALRDAPRMASAMDRIVAGWREGDLQQLESDLLENLKRRPGEYRLFSVDRNRRWLDRLVDLPADGRGYLVVVGVVHLLGDSSLIAMLRERGFDVQCIERPGRLEAGPAVPGQGR